MKIDETYSVQGVDEHEYFCKVKDDVVIAQRSVVDDFTERSVDFHFNGKVCKAAIMKNVTEIDEQWIIRDQL
jgi:hypothetical protein